MRILTGLTLLLALPITTLGQDTIRYTIDFPDPAHHEARVTVEYTNLPPGPIQLRMSRTSPGRYALHEFAKNVYDVRIANGAGRELAYTQPNLHQWDVHVPDGSLRVTYTLFGDRADGTYAAIDRTHGHLNMPAAFMWARGMPETPISITFRPPPGSSWKVATQLAPTSSPMTFTAPHLQYFLDSPTELSDFTLREWTVTSGSDTYTFRLALHHAGTDADADAYTEMAKKVVAELHGVFGELPDFDFGTYTFIADYLPYASGDGMEHRNSTILSSTAPLSTGAVRNLGTLAHEFVHAWSVERLRPATLEPFDFENANISGELWFAEGFTSYYDDLVLRRGGLIDDATFAQRLTAMVDATVRAPGRRFYSPVEMSRQAPFVDAATSVDPQNRANTFLSYYTWGSALGLALDLALRTEFDRTLDDFMRAMWTKYGRYQQNYAPVRPYSLEDLETTLGEVASPAFAEQWFAQYVHGRDVPDYAALLARAGFTLRPAHPDAAWIGQESIAIREGRAVVAGAVLAGSPLYEAGVASGDVIVSIGNTPIRDDASLAAALAGAKPGDSAPITFISRGQTLNAQITFASDPRLEVVVDSAPNALRDAWLTSRAVDGR